MLIFNILRRLFDNQRRVLPFKESHFQPWKWVLFLLVPQFWNQVLLEYSKRRNIWNFVKLSTYFAQISVSQRYVKYSEVFSITTFLDSILLITFVLNFNSPPFSLTINHGPYGVCFWLKKLKSKFVLSKFVLFKRLIQEFELLVRFQ